MNEANKSAVKEAIDKAAEELQPTLPPSRRHPKGRNAYAHIAQVLKGLIGCSYTEAEDEDIDSILEIIKYIKENPF
jgi:hypothetical protein